MSTREGASQNRTAPDLKPIETCRKLLKSREFLSVRYIIQVNQLLKSKRHDDDDQFEQVEAICDLLIAAENRLPNGLKDYYGMIRANRFGPVLLEDFEKLTKLLDKKHNYFPFSQEAADKASLAWSLLSKPPIKAHYDLAISAFFGECSKVKRKIFIPKKQIEVVVISDDDDEEEYGHKIISMARTARGCRS